MGDEPTQGGQEGQWLPRPARAGRLSLGGQLQGGWRRVACSVRKRLPQLAPCRDGHPESYYTAAASRTLGLRTRYSTVPVP